VATWPGVPTGALLPPHSNEWLSNGCACEEPALLRASMTEPARIHRRPRGEAAVPSFTYEVTVRGRLSPGLVTALEGFEVAAFDGGLTHLVGLAPDQKVLYRLFRVLADLNVELVSVNPVSGTAALIDGDQ
jgi:hypothetical protein